MLGLVLLACDEEPATPIDVTLPIATQGEVTWHGEVAPLVEAHCARCHDGTGVAPFDFTDYETVRSLAPLMLAKVDAGEMPPPAADPDCHPYQGSEWMVLDAVDRDLFSEWIGLGSPEGDPSESPPTVPETAAPLSRVDLELRAAGGWTPEFTEGNEYRCFLVGEADADLWISGLEARIDDARVSHHAVLFVDPDGGAEASVTDADSQSWDCPIVPDTNYLTLHAWAPGGGAVELPDDTGLRVPAGAQIVIQMHYYEGATDLRPDAPGYALRLEPSVDAEMYYVALGPMGFVIPAGDPSFTTLYDLPMWLFSLGLLEYEVWGVMPHMHLLGQKYAFTAIDPEGDETCIARADDYDFAMQPTYWFDAPVRVEPEDTLRISCTWDNSADNPNQTSSPPVDVTWGEGTQQEMCYALLYVSARLAF